MGVFAACWKADLEHLHQSVALRELAFFIVSHGLRCSCSPKEGRG